jgi:hypothetical protein
MDNELLLIIVAVMVNGVVDCTLVAWLAGRRSKKALVDWLMSGDEEQQAAIAQIVALAIISPIPTGKKVLDEDGKEHPEVLPLYKFMGRELSNSLIYKLKAVRGGNMSAAGSAAMDGLDGPGLLGSLGPRKGQTMQDWFMEQAIPRVMPMLEKKIADMIAKSGGGAGGF